LSWPGGELSQKLGLFLRKVVESSKFFLKLFYSENAHSPKSPEFIEIWEKKNMGEEYG